MNRATFGEATAKLKTLLSCVSYREVNEDNVLVRNVLVEFEDSLKYVSSKYYTAQEGAGWCAPDHTFSALHAVITIDAHTQYNTIHNDPFHFPPPPSTRLHIWMILTVPPVDSNFPLNSTLR